MKGLGKTGVSEFFLIHADEPVQVGGAATRVGDDEYRFFDLYFFVATKKNTIYYPKKNVG